MVRGIAKKMAVVAMGITIFGSGLVGAKGIVPKQITVPTTVKTVQAKTRKPCTKVNNCTVKLKSKSMYVGPNYAGMFPSTSNWKSSNAKIATVATKGNKEGGHKVTFKKKGKVTISCTVSKTTGRWVKGDVFKWVLTVK